ncbi:MAG TPA: RIP metalloprotease RseP [Terriglobales bacterium]|nr:RIP metalloprotease RseP [Terriglobales bacterium]
MSHFLIAVAATAVVLGIMILVHEFGHYAMAKWFGVRVEVFSIGFGTRLAGFRKGETDYRISAIPLGGYVRMSGENPMEPRTGDPGEFMSHPRWQRFLIAVAGPAMNIILAVVLLTVVFATHYQRPMYLDKPAVIGWVLEDSPAAKAGIQTGDRIVRLDELQNPTWEQVIPKMALSPNQPVRVEIQRGGQVFTRTITPEAAGPQQVGNPGWLPDQPNTVTTLEPGMPADRAGMQIGDDIVAVNGQPMRSIPGLIRYLQDNGGKSVEFTIVRQGQEKKLTMTPEMAEIQGTGEKRWRVGIGSDPSEVTKLPLGAAFTKSLQENKRNSFLIVELVQKMVRRKISIRQIEGPIGIGRASGEAAREGLAPLMQLAAMISLNLGVFNLFPIPILDGGVILMIFIEGLLRRDISLRVKERVYQVAFLFLVLFAVVVIYNDLVKTLPGLAQRLP